MTADCVNTGRKEKKKGCKKKPEGREIQTDETTDGNGKGKRNWASD